MIFTITHDIVISGPALVGEVRFSEIRRIRFCGGKGDFKNSSGGVEKFRGKAILGTQM